MFNLFINTGCDFISYFKSFGKATILNNFFQYATFICGTNMEDSLEQTQSSDRETKCSNAQISVTFTHHYQNQKIVAGQFVRKVDMP